jgi:hypothetical protein
MNHPWPGGLLLALVFLQDPAPVRPDLVAKYAAILENGPESRRDLAARALLTLGRPGCEALKRSPDRDSLPPALVRIPTAGNDEAAIRKLLDSCGEKNADALIRSLGTRAEHLLWERLDASDPSIVAASARLLRELYAAPDPAKMGRPSAALDAELDRRRTFDVNDRPLAEILGEESFSWILMMPRNERITVRLRDVTLRDFFRIATPNLAAVPVGDLLIVIPPDRIAHAEPGDTAWAPSELAPRIESALDALAKGDEGPIRGLTGVGVYHSLLCAARDQVGDAFRRRAREMKKQLEQRVCFIEPAPDEGKGVTIGPSGATAQATVAAFEKESGLALELLKSTKLDGAPPAFRFRNVPARLAARALAFRLNHIY